MIAFVSFRSHRILPTRSPNGVDRPPVQDRDIVAAVKQAIDQFVSDEQVAADDQDAAHGLISSRPQYRGVSPLAGS